MLATIQVATLLPVSLRKSAVVVTVTNWHIICKAMINLIREFLSDIMWLFTSACFLRETYKDIYWVFSKILVHSCLVSTITTTNFELQHFTYSHFNTLTREYVIFCHVLLYCLCYLSLSVWIYSSMPWNHSSVSKTNNRQPVQYTHMCHVTFICL